MSYTEIYVFGKDGNARLYAEISNAWRGAMAIWTIMENRHLPPYIPAYIKDTWWYHDGIDAAELKRILKYQPSRIMPSFSNKENPAKEIWDLAVNPAVPEHERIVLYTTFNHPLVRREELTRVIEAFRKFEGETSLPDQANVLEGLLECEDCIAVGWNHTSVSADTWATIGGFNEETEESIPYNCLTMDKHYWIFDELNPPEKGRAEE